MGLANVLAGEIDVEQVLVKTRVPRLRFLDTGVHSENAWELLESPAMAGTVERLNELADYVIIDTPPVLTSPDAITVAPLVDGVLVVAASARTKLRSLRETVRQLETVGAVIVGGVMNMHKPSGSSKYSGASYTYLRRSAG
jgi:Mrp family chromosome partitioning ATPase